MSNLIPIIVFIVFILTVAYLSHLMIKRDERQWDELIETIKKYRAVTPIEKNAEAEE